MIKDNSDVSYTQLVESLKERDLIKSLGDFRLEVIFLNYIHQIKRLKLMRVKSFRRINIYGK